MRHFVGMNSDKMSEMLGDGTGEPLVSEMGPIDSPFLSRTKRSGLRLTDEGYSYYRERVRGDVTYWRCCNKKCRGRVVQKSENLTRTKEHVHPPLCEAFGQSDTFVAALCTSVQDEVCETMATMPSMNYESCDDPSPIENEVAHVQIENTTPVIVWENEMEELDVKPDIRELEKSIMSPGFREIGVNTEPDGLLVENTMLRMKIQRLEMEVQRYKDTVSRIKADIDILNMT